MWSSSKAPLTPVNIMAQNIRTCKEHVYTLPNSELTSVASYCQYKQCWCELFRQSHTMKPAPSDTLPIVYAAIPFVCILNQKSAGIILLLVVYMHIQVRALSCFRIHSKGSRFSPQCVIMIFFFGGEWGEF